MRRAQEVTQVRDGGSTIVQCHRAYASLNPGLGRSDGRSDLLIVIVIMVFVMVALCNRADHNIFIL